ncbi:MAG TPA: helix-turn-helix domain-containing protein [Acidimicrobiales bacterium]|nr:helix-turn-helix domain-containing protein [Acidimicrobiales bacterium]
MSPSAVTPGTPRAHEPTRSSAPDGAEGQLSALRSLLALAALLVEEEEPNRILHLVATAVPTLTTARTVGIMFQSRWHETAPGEAKHKLALEDLMAVLDPVAGGRLTQRDGSWACAYPLASGRQAWGYLVVGADLAPSDHEHLLLGALARQAGVALANAVLLSRERGQWQSLRVAYSALERSVAIHQRLTRVAAQREGQQGIADAVHDLSGCATAIEDRDGHLWAWAGPGPPQHYLREPPARRNALLRSAMAADGPLRDGGRLISVARVDDEVMGVLVLVDEGEQGDEAEKRTILEHATTVLTMELAQFRSQEEADSRLHGNLVVDLLAGTEEISALSRARALRYDLERPHWVVVVEGHYDGDTLLHAVRRAARDTETGSLMVALPDGVVLLADSQADWHLFYRHVADEVRGGRPQIGVGGRCEHISEFARSYREAQQALKLQTTIGGGDQVTAFDDLGIYQLFCDLPNSAALDQLIERWLGALLAYDARTRSQLTSTLGSYLDHGLAYEATARELSVHRSTLKYRLGRIREISGLDLGDPEARFQLQLAIRAWHTRQALKAQ